MKCGNRQLLAWVQQLDCLQSFFDHSSAVFLMEIRCSFSNHIQIHQFLFTGKQKLAQSSLVVFSLTSHWPWLAEKAGCRILRLALSPRSTTSYFLELSTLSSTTSLNPRGRQAVHRICHRYHCGQTIFPSNRFNIYPAYDRSTSFFLVWGTESFKIQCHLMKISRDARERYGVSVQFSRSVVSNSLQPHESQHARPPCPSKTHRVYPNSCPSSWRCHPAISSSVVPFSSCPQSLSASRSFPMSQLFTWGAQSIGVSALASDLPMNTQDWSPLGWTGWISLQSKGLSKVFSNTTVQKHHFFGTQLSSQSNSHIHTRPLEKP